MIEDDPKPECAHSWQYRGGISMDCLPPIATTRYQCGICETWKLVTDREGEPTEVLYRD